MGRDAELEAILHRLLTPDVRLLTLTGPPGVGKTRLALEAASGLRQHFTHGVVFVDLTPIRDPGLVALTIAQRLDLPKFSDRPILEQLTHLLQERHALLILDNFEQVVDAGLIVADLLRSCPLLSILATSREPLRIDWEHESPVPPLALPDVSGLPVTDRLIPNPAIALFVDRARALEPRFRLDQQNARTIAEICTRLEGLPLAIEMAAPLIKVLSLEAMSEHLAHGLMRLTTGVRNPPDRHQTLREAILWSYSLLSPTEQQLFRRLAVFVGGCALDEAGAICVDGGSEELDLLPVVAALVRKNLLQHNPQPGGESRYRMLESIREFAAEQLRSAGELQTMQRRHAAYFLALVERVEPALQAHGQDRWLNYLARNHDNLREVLRWSESDNGSRETGLRLATALYWFWWVRGYVPEGYGWLKALLAGEAQQFEPALRAKACYAAGFLAKDYRDVEAARRFAQESLTLWQQLGETSGVAKAMVLLGGMYREIPRARSLWEDGLALSHEVGDRLTSARALNGLGEIARFEGDLQQARAFYEESLSIWREAGHTVMVAAVLFNLGQTVMRQGDLSRATSCLRESAKLHKAVGSQYTTVTVIGLAEVAIREGHAVRAARLFGAADALSGGFEGQQALNPPDKAEFDAGIAMTRAALTEEEFSSVWSEGRTLTVEQALEYAMSLSPSLGHGQQTRRRSPLTSREREVAGLVAAGRTNREIAGQLHITERTAEKHVENILNRLGFDSRTQIAAWAVEDRFRSSGRN